MGLYTICVHVVTDPENMNTHGRFLHMKALHWSQNISGCFFWIIMVDGIGKNIVKYPNLYKQQGDTWVYCPDNWKVYFNNRSMIWI